MIVVVCLVLSAVGGAWAQEHDGRQGRGSEARDDGGAGRSGGGMRPQADDRPMRDAQRAERSDALADSVRRIERTTRGQVLSAERMQADGREVNRIKVMDDRGRVRVYMDDPQQPGGGTRTRDHDR